MLFELSVVLVQFLFCLWGYQPGLENSLDAEGQVEGFKGELVRSDCVHVISLLSVVLWS